MQTAIVEKWAVENGAALTATQLNRLATHQEMVLEKNKVMNLTTITDPHDFAVKHIIDSMTLLPYIPSAQGASLADIGAGAGFPGMVLATLREDLQVTLVDSLRKRVLFLQEVVEALGLKNVSCVHARAEDLARAGAMFDICTARAVARMDKLVKWALPITKPGGLFLAMKGAHVQAELEEAKPALAKFGGAVKTVDLIEIAPGLVHSVVVVEKLERS